MKVLVRLMKGGEVEPEDLDALNNAELLDLAVAGAGGRTLLHKVTVKLNERGVTFAQIGEHVGATESAASRWAKPAARPGRRRQAPEGEAEQ